MSIGTPSEAKQVRPVVFNTQLAWLENKKGILNASDAHGSIQVATPRQFGGEGQEWSPEHLLLASVSSCFMTTFLFFAHKFDFTFLSFNCSASGRVELVNGKYEFTQIDVYPKVHIANESQRAGTEQVLLKTSQYCLISASLKCRVVYHTEIITALPAQTNARTGSEHIM